MSGAHTSAEGLITEDRVEGDYFFHPPQPAFEEDLAVVCCGRERCLAGYRVERKDFPFPAIEYVTAGNGSLRLGGREWALKPGTLFTYGPGMAHRLEARGGGLIKYFVDFTGSRAAALLEAQALPPGSVQVLGSRRWTTDLLDQLVACAGLPRSKANLLAPRLLELLLLRVADDFQVQAALPAESAAAETYARCRDFLRENHARISKLDEAASACGVSVPYLVRLFQRHSRETAYRFLTRLKMEHAADLLLKRSLSVQAVAREVGFSDPYLFSRAFKRYQGVSPKHFREEFHRPLPGTGDGSTGASHHSTRL